MASAAPAWASTGSPLRCTSAVTGGPYSGVMATERARAWAATMAGHEGRPPRTGAAEEAAPRSPAIRLAHADSHAAVGSVRTLRREEREEVEALQLAPGATRGSGAGHRRRVEPADAVRTCFERDRDRILHASAFRRLAGKTQVFVFPDDHQRTRLTHALEVTQVASSVARALRLNVPLTEAIALAHDCGHGPGGHASEDALAPYVAGGYDHAVWGADVVLDPLNLCVETLDGVRNHSWSRPAPSTPEGEVVSWADRIAYVCHDFEDAASAGIVSVGDLPPLVAEHCGTARRGQLQAFIDGMVGAAALSGRVGLLEPLAEALAAFRNFNYERIYLRPASVAQGERVVELLQALVEHYAAHPRDLPPAHRPRGAAAGTADTYRAAVGYVGGMTDRFACEQAVTMLAWSRRSLPTGFDVRG